MKNEKGKLYYGLGLDNDQLRADASESRNIIKSIGDSTAAEGARIDNAYRKIAGTVAAVFTVQQAAAFAKSIVQVRGEIEALEISFETLLGNKQKANALFSEIKTYAVNTPMQMNDLAKGAQMLLSFNVEAERVMPILKQIGDISMGDAQKFNSLTLAFSQMSSTGKLMGQDLLQMINAGFNPLSVMSEKTGKSIGQLKKEMEGGLITSQMVADAFAAATAEGGKFYGMLDKQSKGINGSMSNLTGAITDMFNDLGTKNQEFITDTIQGATTAVKHYKEIGEALAVIVATYGTYKAAIMATEAVRQSIETVQRTEEAVELMKLLSVEQQAKISKLGLAKTSTEYAAAVKAEVAANVQSAQSALAKARTEVSAASQIVVARREEYVAAKQLESQRLAELMSIGATGSAKQVEAAQRKLSAAEMQRESAALAFQSATRDFNAKKTVVETAARTANTTATAANTAVQTANVTATSILSVAKTRLTAAAARLNAVIMANPYALAAAAVIALAYGIYKLITYQTEAEKAQSKLNATIKEADKSLQSETYQIDLMFARLKAAKKGTEDYEAAKKAIINQYGEYLKKLGDEKTALNDVAAAYALITEEATKAANARAIQQVTTEAGNIVSEKSSDTYDEIKKLLNKKYKGKKGSDGKINLADEYLIKLRPVIMKGAEITPEIEKILKDFDKTGGYMSGGSPMFGGGTWVSTVSNSIREELNSLSTVRAAAEKTVKEATEKFGDTPVEDSNKPKFDATTASLQQLMEQLPKAKEELEALKKAEKPDPAAISAKEQEVQQIKDQTAAREKSVTAIKDVKAQIELLQKEQEKYGKDDAEYKDLEARIKSLKTKLPKTEGQESKAETDAARIKRETAERTQKINEYEEAVKRQVKQSELDISQAHIDALEEGYAKEKKQIDLTYDRMIFANQQREAEMVKALQDARELDWENKNPKAKAKGETFDRNTVTAADLSPEQKAQIEAYTDIANDYKEKSETDLLKKLLDKYLTFEQQRTEINKRFDSERKTIENSNKSQSEKDAAISVLEKKRKEEIKSVNDEEVETMQKSSDLMVQLFADASQKSVKELRNIINTTEELLQYLEQTNVADITPKFGFTAEQLVTLKESPEKLKALRKAIKDLNGELGSRSPFEKFSNDIQKAIDKIKSGDIGGGLEGIGSSIQAIMPTVKQFGEDLGTIFGDSQIGEDIGILTELIGGIGKGIQGIGQIASGDILGGITSVVSGIASIFSMANAAAERHREALKEVMNSKIEQQREYNLLLLKQNLLYEQGTTIFGNDGYGKALNAIEVYKKALADLNDAMAGNDAQKKSQKGRNHILAMFGIKDAQATLKQIYAGLADIEIVTGHKKTGLFGWGKGKDLYSSVLSVYPDLIKANGEFNKELAQTIIQTRKMSDEDKNALQNMVELYEQYEEAMQQVRDYLSGIFGELGNSMSDALVDAFKNGTDAGEAFYKSVSEMLENLAKQMIYSVTLAPIMEKAQAQMLEIMKNGNLSDAEKFAQYANVLSNLTDEAIAQQGNANDLMKMYQDMAAQKGIDIFQPDEEREASKRGIATASQESVDENNGRLTAIQGHTYMLVENSKILVTNSNKILDHLAGIEGNTKSLIRLEKIENDMGTVKSTLNDIALKGIRIKT